MPLHLVFGLELNGAQELRPKKLAILYLSGSTKRLKCGKNHTISEWEAIQSCFFELKYGSMLKDQRKWRLWTICIFFLLISNIVLSKRKLNWLETNKSSSFFFLRTLTSLWGLRNGDMICRWGSWFLMDLVLITIDAVIISLEILSEAGRCSWSKFLSQDLPDESAILCHILFVESEVAPRSDNRFDILFLSCFNSSRNKKKHRKAKTWCFQTSEPHRMPRCFGRGKCLAFRAVVSCPATVAWWTGPVGEVFRLSFKRPCGSSKFEPAREF